MRSFENYLKQTIRAVAFVHAGVDACGCRGDRRGGAGRASDEADAIPRRSTSSRSSDLRPRVRRRRPSDEKFVDAIIGATGSREKAFEETTKRAWIAIQAGKVREAAVRFNQAFLISPEQSTVYHGFAVIAQARFNDFDAADELFKIALKQPNPVKALKADYGRLLLIAKRPRDAQEVLDQAVKEIP